MSNASVDAERERLIRNAEWFEAMLETEGDKEWHACIQGQWVTMRYSEEALLYYLWAEALEDMDDDT